MITLPDITFVMVETLNHGLARLAMEDCISKVEFGEILLLTDKPELFDGLGKSITNGHSKPVTVRVHQVPNWPTKLDWCRAIWFTVPPLIRTSRILLCQWDAGVWNPDDWDDEFLKYDYIGALWQWHPSKRVGNSGFCLKSTRLARYIYDRPDKFPCYAEVEDDLLSRTYRTDLEERGFIWAPENLAHKFAFEGCGPNPRPQLKSHFGFHGAFNFPKVFSEQQLEVRSQLMYESEYIQDLYKRQDRMMLGRFAEHSETLSSMDRPEVPPEDQPSNQENNDA